MCRSPDWLPGRKKALEEEKEDSRAHFAILTKARELKVPAADGWMTSHARRHVTTLRHCDHVMLVWTQDYVTEEFILSNFINDQFRVNGSSSPGVAARREGWLACSVTQSASPS